MLIIHVPDVRDSNDLIKLCKASDQRASWKWHVFSYNLAFCEIMLGLRPIGTWILGRKSKTEFLCCSFDGVSSVYDSDIFYSILRETG